MVHEIYVGLVSDEESRCRNYRELFAVDPDQSAVHAIDRAASFSMLLGDTLLLEARPSFVDQYSNSREFLLVSALEGGVPPRHERAGIASIILVGMVLATSFAGEYRC